MTLASNILQRASKRYFAPAQHLWYRTVQKDKVTWRVQIGMTNKGLENIGDVTAVELVKDDLRKAWMASKNATVKAGEELVTLQWEGYTQTTADELYHTVWESVEGTEAITSPVTGEIVHTVNIENEGEIDEETVLVDIACTATDLDQAASHWVDEMEYEKTLRSATPGKFSDTAVDQSSAST